MKKNVKLAVICSAAVICVIAIAGIIFGVKKAKSEKALKTGKIVLGFYDIDKSQEEVFTNIIEDICSQKGLALDFYKIKHDEDFEKQLADNKVNLILAPGGFAVKKAVAASKEDAVIQPQITGGLFSSMRQSIITEDDKLKALPLIFDNLEIDIEVSAFKMSGMEQIASWDDIELFAQIQKRDLDYPVSFAGAEPDFLIDLLGALGEALEGYEAYNQAVDIIKAAVDTKKEGADFNAATLAKKIFIDPDAPLPYSLYYLKQLIKKGYITPASKQLVHTDINSYIQQRVSRVFFTNLSVHRTYDTKAVSRFSTIYLPSKNPASSRRFTAKTTYAVPLTANKNVAALIEELISTQTQEALSQQTGLAPVLANCRTPDQQADDARYWVAATKAPLAGLSREVELSQAELKALADEVRLLLF